ncbi:hypothetical protein [Paraburkholderia unamae]|uniref:Uncharacterized protein n=1 Tax=Paraburkholderia unamae TaxID=219649 RepID=A0ABX5KRX8_9BURK|nr:hypothetical protein [Paraburkholderia unamae]PVX83669.1 hypothetical protein C7402_10673 [Paraburkholderia unamae]RAR63815.1 hypothetical protein C7401_10572 [Paraburkholderia unamae]
MQQQVRSLTLGNVEQITNEFVNSISEIGESIHGLRGIALFTALKRTALGHGPYPHVTLFEAANRIMSDLVILRGVAGLLRAGMFGIDTYLVEFGNENKNGFDIRGESALGHTIIGEAFNVAPSYFTGKRWSSVEKLKNADATHRLLLVNDDAVSPTYEPMPKTGLHYVFVNIETGAIRVLSSKDEATPTC